MAGANAVGTEHLARYLYLCLRAGVRLGPLVLSSVLAKKASTYTPYSVDAQHCRTVISGMGVATWRKDLLLWVVWCAWVLGVCIVVVYQYTAACT